MKRKGLILMLMMLGSTWACSGNGDAAELGTAAQELLRAMDRGDTSHIAAMVADSVALRRTEFFGRRAPTVVSAGAEEIDVQNHWMRGDSAGIDFTVDTDSGEETVQMTFVRDAEDQWLLVYVTFPARG